MSNPFDADPTNQPVVWAGVVLRLQDGSFMAYEFDHADVGGMSVHLETSSEEMTRQQMVEALARGDMGRLTRNQRVEVTVCGRPSMWLEGLRTSRREFQEQQAVQEHRERLARRELPQVP